MNLKIEAFMHRSNNKIPQKYTCDSGEISPGMSWNEVPEHTQSFAVIMEDLDVPGRSNTLALWLVYNIPATVREIKTGLVPQGAQVGINDLGKTHYSGPCPEPGTHHQRYRIQLYALDMMLDLKDGITEHAFLTAAKNHILDRAEAIATYERHK